MQGLLVAKRPGSDDKKRTFLIKKGHGIDIFLIFAEKKGLGASRQVPAASLHGPLARAPCTDLLHGLLALAMQVPTQPQAEQTEKDKRKRKAKDKPKSKGKPGSKGS